MQQRPPSFPSPDPQKAPPWRHLEQLTIYQHPASCLPLASTTDNHFIQPIVLSFSRSILTPRRNSIHRRPINFRRASIFLKGWSGIDSTSHKDRRKALMVNATTHGSGKRDEQPSMSLTHPPVIALESDTALLSCVKESHKQHQNIWNGSKVAHCSSARTIIVDPGRVILQYRRIGSG